MSLYKGEAQVISSVIGDYFVEELKSYRRSYNNSSDIDSHTGENINQLYFSGTIGDVSTWAAFDHLEHPEWKRIDKRGTGEMHSFSNSTEEEKGWGAWTPYVRKYFSGIPQFSARNGRENALIYQGGIYRFGNKDLETTTMENQRLENDWGISMNSQLDLTRNIHLYNEQTYREFSRALLTCWDTSQSHYGALVYEYIHKIGISIVNEYAYFNAVY